MFFAVALLSGFFNNTPIVVLLGRNFRLLVRFCLWMNFTGFCEANVIDTVFGRQKWRLFIVIVFLMFCGDTAAVWLYNTLMDVRCDTLRMMVPLLQSLCPPADQRSCKFHTLIFPPCCLNCIPRQLKTRSKPLFFLGPGIPKCTKTTVFV